MHSVSKCFEIAAEYEQRVKAYESLPVMKGDVWEKAWDSSIRATVLDCHDDGTYNVALRSSNGVENNCTVPRKWFSDIYLVLASRDWGSVEAHYKTLLEAK